MGFDLACLRIDPPKRTIFFAGAYFESFVTYIDLKSVFFFEEGRGESSLFEMSLLALMDLPKGLFFVFLECNKFDSVFSISLWFNLYSVKWQHDGSTYCENFIEIDFMCIRDFN